MVGRRPARRGRPRARGRRRRGAGRAGVPGAHECAHGSAPDSAAAANTHSRCSESSGRSTARCRPNPEAVGTCARSTAPRAGSSTWSRSGPAPGDPAAYVGQVVADPLGERLRQLAAGAVVGEHLVAARPLDRRGERPGAGDLDLEVPGVALERLLEHVEVLGEQAAGPPLVAGPARRRSAASPRAGGRRRARPTTRQRPARHRARWRRARGARAGAAGRAARRRRCARPRPGRSRAGSRRRSRGSRGTASRPRVRAVAVMVAEPTTRVPS